MKAIQFFHPSCHPKIIGNILKNVQKHVVRCKENNENDNEQ